MEDPAAASAPTFLAVSFKFARIQPGYSVGVSRDVWNNTAAGIMAGLCELRGSIGFRAVGAEKIADGTSVAPRRLRHDGGRRATVSLGRCATGRTSREF